MEWYSGLSDKELVKLMKEDDQSAYTEIYNRYKTLLYIFAIRRLGDREGTKDLIHELFLSIWANRVNINLTKSLSAYLYTAARNRIIDIITHRQVSSRYIDSFQRYIEQTEDNTDHLIRHKELLALIDHEISALPKKMREVFELSRKTNYTRKQIADHLNLSEQTVKSHMQHALKILKTKLGSLFFMVFL